MSNEVGSADSNPRSFDGNRWSMSSNSGREQLDVVVISRIDTQTSLCSLGLRRSFWQRDRPLAEAQMTTDFDVALAQVIVDIDALGKLLADLRGWRDDGVHFERQLTADSAGQKLVMSIGEDPSRIYSVDKPAFMVRYDCGTSMSAKWVFVVDQSCVFLAMESIAEVLESITRDN